MKQKLIALALALALAGSLLLGFTVGRATALDPRCPEDAVWTWIGSSFPSDNYGCVPLDDL